MALDRPDAVAAGLQEGAAVRGIYTAPDGAEYVIEKERAVLKKFDGEVDEMTPEEAERNLAEVLVIEDGVIVDHWTKGEARDAPS